jgi:hypothetical protein
LIPSASKKPIDLSSQFTQWVKDLNADHSLAAAQTMVQRKWYDIEEVAAKVNSKKNATLIELFNKESPSTSTIQMISSAYLENHSFLKQINQALEWDCTKGNSAFRTYLYKLKDQLTSRNLETDLAGEDYILDIQDKILK